MTRTRSSIRLPETLLPRDFPPSPHIQLVTVKKESDKEAPNGHSRFAASRNNWGKSKTTSGKAPSRSYTELRRSFKEAYKPWTRAADDELLERYRQDGSIANIARQMERQPSAIRARLRKLGVFNGEDE